MSSAEAPPSSSSFLSVEAEVEFWRAKSKEAEVKADEARDELQEFQEGSRELEAELETQLEQSEKRVKELRTANNRMQLDGDQLKAKLEECQREYHCQVAELHDELAGIKGTRDQLNIYVRDLEQQNDDLERAKRCTIASLEDFESRMNKAIERNAFLESELDEKESLKDAVQRMKDETRDLKSELRSQAPPRHSLSMQNSFNGGSIMAAPDNDKDGCGANGGVEGAKRLHRRSTADSNKFAADCESKSESGSVMDTPPASSKSSPKTGQLGPSGQPMTPSARISALNIVGDLLRKVGALEVKLMSCRNIVKENSTSPSANSSVSGDTTPDVNGRTRRMTRGQSTPSLKKMGSSSPPPTAT
jgi:hypothetical protein